MQSDALSDLTATRNHRGRIERAPEGGERLALQHSSLDRLLEIQFDQQG